MDDLDITIEEAKKQVRRIATIIATYNRGTIHPREEDWRLAEAIMGAVGWPIPLRERSND